MAPSKKARQATAKTHNEAAVTFTFRIPCFPHQDLDPARFPEGTGTAIGGPMTWSNTVSKRGGGVVDWEDLDDDQEAEEEEEMDVADAQVAKKPPVKRKRETKSKPKPDDAYKRMMVPGGRPAIAKKVTADLDSDDDMIIRMKNAKHLEKDIAKRLADEGRIAYNPKTIGTRHARIMRALQQQQDDLLDAELTDWHDGDDDALEQAVAKAEVVVQKMKDTADAKKWKIVAGELKQIKPVVNFSQNACRSRFDALKEGTAKPTPESILDPDENVLARIQSRLEKEKKIEDDALLFSQHAANLQGNAWTSRPVKYF